MLVVYLELEGQMTVASELKPLIMRDMEAVALRA